ncbi:uridine kinase family-domain-containing protein [Halteromyces radiatus]|uniref:uridine kinase family-domain-containing protein n=1 Tax=Halteromyces radiatus TaxID=101107 RepID=UPI0022200EF3|nr:uridine kinase family-domain-containing protein [Halteromyces radiatus]KAI8096752.1 uridine kinase family-domain-containing protein [Halteromyces radiatus]
MSIDASAYADPNYFKVSLQTPMLVGIAGGAQAGKFELCEILMSKFKGSHETKVAIISLTDFYRELTPDERVLFESGDFNLDHPNVFDFDLLEFTLRRLLQNKDADIPLWDHAKHTKVGVRKIQAVDVLLLEGTLALYPKNLRDLMFMKVFIDVDSDQRLIRRTKKLTEGTGRTMSIKELLSEYVNFVKPMFDEFIAPSKKYADIIIPRGYENLPALQVLEHHLEDHLHTRAKVTSTSSSSSLSSSATTSSSLGNSYQNRHYISPVGKRNSIDVDRTTAPISIKSNHTDILATSAESRYKDIPE